MNVLTFEVTFHAHFRVGASYGYEGIDAAVNRDDPLPADHLKGLMLDGARHLLDLGVVNGSVIDQTFGSTRNPSPWNWSNAAAPQPWEIRVRHRVLIDSETHAARRDHVVFGEEAWVPQATFRVTQLRPLDATDSIRQAALLRLSARWVHALGSTRRRGLGVVGVRPIPEVEVADDLAMLRDMAGVQR